MSTRPADEHGDYVFHRSGTSRAYGVELYVSPQLGVMGLVGLSPGAVAVWAEFVPRVIRRAVEKAVAAAVAGVKRMVQAQDIEETLGLRAKTSVASTPSRLH